MKSPTGARLLLGMKTAQQRLIEYRGTDEDVAWNYTAEFLAALYRCREAEKVADPAYFAHEAADADGVIVAALIRFRAQVEHDGRSDVRALGLTPVERLVRTAEGWVPTERMVFFEGEWRKVRTRRATWVWPATPPTDLSRYPGTAATYTAQIAEKPVDVIAARATRYFERR